MKTLIWAELELETQKDSDCVTNNNKVILDSSWQPIKFMFSNAHGSEALMLRTRNRIRMSTPFQHCFIETESIFECDLQFGVWGLRTCVLPGEWNIFCRSQSHALWPVAVWRIRHSKYDRDIRHMRSISPGSTCIFGACITDIHIALVDPSANSVNKWNKNAHNDFHCCLETIYFS